MRMPNEQTGLLGDTTHYYGTTTITSDIETGGEVGSASSDLTVPSRAVLIWSQSDSGADLDLEAGRAEYLPALLYALYLNDRQRIEGDERDTRDWHETQNRSIKATQRINRAIEAYLDSGMIGRVTASSFPDRQVGSAEAGEREDGDDPYTVEEILWREWSIEGDVKVTGELLTYFHIPSSYRSTAIRSQYSCEISVREILKVAVDLMLPPFTTSPLEVLRHPLVTRALDHTWRYGLHGTNIAEHAETGRKKKHLEAYITPRQVIESLDQP